VSDIIKPASPLNLAPEALTALPVFPLPGVLLLPGTLISLHIFEPRYRRMMEDVLEGHRAIAVAMLNERGPPDRFGRPPVHGVASVGVRRSARLPDAATTSCSRGAAGHDREEIDRPSIPTAECGRRRW
jgi:hypothetical protein